MEIIEQSQEKMKVDIDELKGNMSKMMKMLQTLTTKEDQPHSTVISQISGFTIDHQSSQRVNTTWPEWGI